MSTQGMMCLGLLLIPVLAFVVLFLVLPLVQSTAHRGQWRCPNCGAVLHETVETPAVLHETVDARGAGWTGLTRTSRQLCCGNCGYGVQERSHEYRAPVPTTSLGGWLRRRFAPGLARPWERYADEEAFRERVEGNRAKTHAPQAKVVRELPPNIVLDLLNP